MNQRTKLTLMAVCLLSVATWVAAAGNLNAQMVTMTPQDAFAPKNLQVPPGATVTWQNRDEDPHTVTADIDEMGPDSGATFPGGLAKGQQFTWTVPTSAMSGTVYYYHCKFHGTAGDGKSYGKGMVGSIIIK